VKHWLDAFVSVGQGAAETAAIHQLKTDPKIKRRMRQKHKRLTEGCTPCAAGAYVENLRKMFGGSGG